MDIVYLAVAALFWAVAIALAFGCERLQNRKAAP